jgi:hypothetical protein
VREYYVIDGRVAEYDFMTDTYYFPGEAEGLKGYRQSRSGPFTVEDIVRFGDARYYDVAYKILIKTKEDYSIWFHCDWWKKRSLKKEIKKLERERRDEFFDRCGPRSGPDDSD